MLNELLCIVYSILEYFNIINRYSFLLLLLFCEEEWSSVISDDFKNFFKLLILVHWQYKVDKHLAWRMGQVCFLLASILPWDCSTFSDLNVCIVVSVILVESKQNVGSQLQTVYPFWNRLGESVLYYRCDQIILLHMQRYKINTLFT